MSRISSLITAGAIIVVSALLFTDTRLVLLIGAFFPLILRKELRAEFAKLHDLAIGSIEQWKIAVRLVVPDDKVLFDALLELLHDQREQESLPQPLRN